MIHGSKPFKSTQNKHKGRRGFGSGTPLHAKRLHNSPESPKLPIPIASWPPFGRSKICGQSYANKNLHRCPPPALAAPAAASASDKASLLLTFMEFPSGGGQGFLRGSPDLDCSPETPQLLGVNWTVKIQRTLPLLASLSSTCGLLRMATAQGLTSGLAFLSRVACSLG